MELLEAIAKGRAAGYRKMEAYTPLPVHEVWEALVGAVDLCCEDVHRAADHAVRGGVVADAPLREQPAALRSLYNALLEKSLVRERKSAASVGSTE